MSSINWVRWCVAFAAILTAAYSGFRYFVYVSISHQLQQPDSGICSGDVGCIAEIKGEYYADFLIGGVFFAPIIFAFILAALACIFVMLTFLSETKPWRKFA